MGSQIPMNSDRTRTNWTPAMERYFIDLLLDQVHRGNRMGHTFNKQAWTDMLTMFNAYFGSPYDEKVLKSHYTNLWTQFNDIKILLDQNGFSWDDTKQMVVASHHVWDSYAKAHPEAQSYRNKALMNFDDLCLIYAHTTADGRYSRSSHDLDFDDDIQGLNIGIGVNSLLPASKKHSRKDWTLAMDRYFVKLMLHQLKKGHKVHNTFKNQAWKDMLTLFNGKYGTKYGRSFLKHRYKKLFKYYTDMKRLLEVKGFSWDEKQQKIAAADYAWDTYIKAHPDASQYRKKTLLNCRDLELIFGNAVSNGHFSHFQRGKNFEVEEKEGHSSAGSECQRMIWTSPMDRYFIELLQDQVLSGNKIGHGFVAEAWIEMVKLFNAKFGTHYDKDALKNRYKHLRRQYNDIKVLLEQGGFSWDETREMVTAEDYVWDSYTKVHPDARSYKNTSVPSYHKLCVIYGEEVSNGRHSVSACNADLESEDPDLMIGARLSNSHHWRTDWTPPMDRYFIDLMLEQVCNGSIVDHKFNKLAWSDMVSKFSAEFGYQYDKDVLKSRFMNLRKRFNDMKTLLDHSGFAWDEMQQMITAEDDLWHGYVKEHPDARTYRNRTLPNFNDLFFIYGSENTGKRSNYSSHTMEAEDCMLGVNIGEEDDQSPANSDPLGINWTRQMDRYFIDLMLEQLHRGNKIYGTYNEQAWTWMIASFNKKFGLICDKDVLEDRYLSLMKEYTDVLNLLNHYGFAWDEIDQTLIADDDVWMAYIKEHPDAIAYRDRILDGYSDLGLIYGNDSWNGRTSSLDIKFETDNNAFGMGINDVGDMQSPSGEFEMSRKRKKRKSASSSTSACTQKVQRTLGEEIQEAAEEKSCLVKTHGGAEEDKDYSSIECIVAALQTVPDMDDELFLEACELLEDERKAKMFVAMDVTARRKWLLKKLRR
ncbi:hypothetical protein F2P56_013293 [Juglans regia]|uniref:L10-interacting MYB domain-containing protein n=1 Tax=Juglans regia TaxID=51240 RepID=A0A834CYZ3_JUGRE|nr:hypothetical protein F2P56_013293 [Juglans regia]